MKIQDIKQGNKAVYTAGSDACRWAGHEFYAPITYNPPRNEAPMEQHSEIESLVHATNKTIGSQSEADQG